MLSTTEKTEDIQHTRQFRVQYKYGEWEKEQGFIEAQDKNCMYRLSKCVMSAISDGRRYMIQWQRKEERQPWNERDIYPITVTHTVTIKLDERVYA